MKVTAVGGQMAHSGVMKGDRAIWTCVLLLLLSSAIACTNGNAEKPKSDKLSAAVDHSNAGADLYHAYCASCHGRTGRGDGPAAATLKVPPPDLTALARRSGGRFPDGQIYQVIEWGGAIASHGSRQMPVWGVAFRPLSGENQRVVSARIHSLTDYLASIQLK
ncbi:MAG: cytochrome c [Acidobacteriia bacterium]|nr:cytochrome c [Terriglobia bacterium]